MNEVKEQVKSVKESILEWLLAAACGIGLSLAIFFNI